MSDLISRQDAIDAIERNAYRHTYIEQIIDIIKELPSAQQKGKWEMTDAYPHRVYCSVCYKTYLRNKDWIDELGVPMNFCPNCGASMERGEETT